MVELFWIRRPEGEEKRQVDPLSFSSLHESLSDCLLPHISGRTRKADEYLWVLLGLYFAETQGADTGSAVWKHFERFEKALKLYWYFVEKRQSGFSGVDQIKDIDINSRTLNLDFRLLSNQRSLGLLGAYIRSLYNIGLVKDSRSLRLSQEGRTLAASLIFPWSGDVTGRWRNAFAKASASMELWMFKRLGQCLFSNDTMKDVAYSVSRTGRWLTASKYIHDPNKARIAEVAEELARHMRIVQQQFYALLENPHETLRPPLLSRRAARTIDTIEPGGAINMAPFTAFFRPRFTSPGAFKAALLELHRQTWEEEREHVDPWIDRKLTVRPDIRVKVRNLSVPGWNFRWQVARSLMSQTRWKAT